MKKDSPKQKLGTFVHDWPRFLLSLRPTRSSLRRSPWCLMRNRNDRLLLEPTEGVKCAWSDTRTLHLCDVFPVAGKWLLRRALKDWPICLRDTPDPSLCDERPNVSFIIGHKGRERLPNLLITLQSIAGQTGTSFECIVVEQDKDPIVSELLPDWIQYIHVPTYLHAPYNRSAAFNEGVRMAKGQIFILHDNDMVVPSGYAAEHVRQMEKGFEVFQLKRWIFYLQSVPGHNTHEAFSDLCRISIQQVLENSCGGGSMGITPKAFFEIGGMDEEFVGWGGEDVEFWERALTRKTWQYGYLPLIHLWHESQPKKHDANNRTTILLKNKLAIPCKERIQNRVKSVF